MEGHQAELAWVILRRCPPFLPFLCHWLGRLMAGVNCKVVNRSRWEDGKMMFLMAATSLRRHYTLEEGSTIIDGWLIVSLPPSPVKDPFQMNNLNSNLT